MTDPNSGTLAPWCADEKWIYGEDEKGKWAQVNGRKLAPESLKSDLLWAIENSFEQQVFTTYHPEWPQWQRELFWNFLRNPFQNARLFVWGVADRNYTVRVIEGNPNPMVVMREDVAETGWQKTRLFLDDGTTRDWEAYSSPKLSWYHGCQPSGIYGVKFVPRIPHLTGLW